MPPKHESPWPDDVELDSAEDDRPPDRLAAIPRPAEPVRPDVRNWWTYAAQAWAWPLRQGVGDRLLGWALVHTAASALFGFLFRTALKGSSGVELLASFTAALVLASFCALHLTMLGVLAWYMLRTVHSAAWDADEPAPLPQFDNAMESLLRPLGHVAASAGVAAFPLWLAVLPALLGIAPDWWRHVMLGAAVLSLLTLPLVLLAVAVADGAGAAKLRYAVRALAGAPAPALAASLLCAPGLALSVVVPAGVVFWGGVGFLVIPALELAWVYLLTVGARGLGALFWCCSGRMGWMKFLKPVPDIPERRLARTPTAASVDAVGPLDDEETR